MGKSRKKIPAIKIAGSSNKKSRTTANKKFRHRANIMLVEVGKKLREKSTDPRIRAIEPKKEIKSRFKAYIEGIKWVPPGIFGLCLGGMSLAMETALSWTKKT